MSSINFPRSIPIIHKDAEQGDPLAAVAEAATRLRFGAIQLTVHDGKIVQLDVTEHQRFT